VAEQEGLTLGEMLHFPLCKAEQGSRRLLSVNSMVQEFRPTKTVQEILVCILTIVLLLFLYTHRKDVITLLTGDDRIHATLPDFCWYGLCQCGGLCKFEWCVCLTSLPCCPKRWRGSHPIKLMGQQLGLTSRTIELSNIVVGDLPTDSYGSFYIKIECGKYPEIVSAVQEDKDPRVVHFPEVLTLRIRESMWDSLVEITVYSSYFIGVWPLCQVRLDPRAIADWAHEDEPHCTKRFAMKPEDPNREGIGETPPWISLTFGVEQADVRRLDRFHANQTMSVRIATWDRYDPVTNEPFEEQPLMAMKHRFPLVDGHGNAVQEPEESDLAWLSGMRSCLTCLYSILSFFVTLFVVGYGSFRYYVKKCYDSFETLTIAKSWKPHEFPMPTCAMRSIDAICAAKLDGTGVKPGQHICRPTDESVELTCDDPPQDRPKAFNFVLEDLGLGRNQGLPCFQDVCRYNNRIKHYDQVAFFGSIAALCFIFCCFRPLANKFMQQMTSTMQKVHNSKIHQMLHRGV